MKFFSLNFRTSENVVVRLRNEKKFIEGVISGFDDDCIYLKGRYGGVYLIPRVNIFYIRQEAE